MLHGCGMIGAANIMLTLAAAWGYFAVSEHDARTWAETRSGNALHVAETSRWRLVLFRARRQQSLGKILGLWHQAVLDKQALICGQHSMVHCMTLAAHCVTNLAVPATAAAQIAAQDARGDTNGDSTWLASFEAHKSLQRRLKLYSSKERLYLTLCSAFPILLPRNVDPWRLHMLLGWTFARWLQQSFRLKSSRGALAQTVMMLSLLCLTCCLLH